MQHLSSVVQTSLLTAWKSLNLSHGQTLSLWQAATEMGITWGSVLIPLQSKHLHSSGTAGARSFPDKSPSSHWESVQRKKNNTFFFKLVVHQMWYFFFDRKLSVQYCLPSIPLFQRAAINYSFFSPFKETAGKMLSLSKPAAAQGSHGRSGACCGSRLTEHAWAC